MAYTVPTVEDLRARFPEFAFDDYSDDFVQAQLEEAAQSVDTDWDERDYSDAIIYLTAHQLTLWNTSAGAFAGTNGSGPINQISVEGRSVGFDTNKQLSWVNQNDVERGSTFYGQQYLRIRDRNVRGPRVTPIPNGFPYGTLA